MGTTHSSDGARIVYDVVGSGPPLVLVDGALCTRKIGPGKGLARLLSEHFTVITYDRRGRGESGDAPGYTVEREVDDLAAVINVAGENTFVFGQSSGAILALHAANRLSQITRLAVYEAPFIIDDSRPPTGHELHDDLTDLVGRGRRAQAVGRFLSFVGLPRPIIWAMHLTPLWGRLKALAPTLLYDSLITVRFQQGAPLPATEWANLRQDTLVVCGSASRSWMQNGMRALAGTLPNATYRTLEGQTHHLRPKAIVPDLIEFFSPDLLVHREQQRAARSIETRTRRP